jgi:hypothetical protein
MRGASHLVLPDAAALADLATFLGRAARVDPDGAARLVGHGDVLAVYVSPVHGGGGPTVLGLRTTGLAVASDVDCTVSIAALADRFARLRSASAPAPDPAEPVSLPLPPMEAAGVAWAGMVPPRWGWDAVGLVEPAVLRAAAAAGIQEVAAGAPTGSGANAVTRLRALVWGRQLVSGPGGDVPAGMAFALVALGFLTEAEVEVEPEAEPLALYRSGPWARLTSSRGHVLARTPALL